MSQAISVIEEVTDWSLAGPVTPALPPMLVGEARVLTDEVGHARAAQGIHPADSLQAATTLFEVALANLTIEPNSAGQPTPELAIALHSAIMRRVALAALPYVTFLLKKLQSAHLEERRRIARELHDRVAHGVGVALQNLELSHYYAGIDDARAQEKLAVVADTLREALQTVRQLSAELRDFVGEQGLAGALGTYLRSNVPAQIRTQFTTEGDSKQLPNEVSEELYLVLREAVRNAVLHGLPTTISVWLEVTAAGVHGRVVDDGLGFEADRATNPNTGGLASMRERAELLGGTAGVITAPGQGTTVEVSIPLPRAAP